MQWDPQQPFNQLPLLPLSSELMESIPVLKACIKARAALAELKQAGELLPNQGLLINLIPLLEAKDSSEIENIVTTSDNLFQFFQEDSQADTATKEALRYRTALYEGFTHLAQLRALVEVTTDYIRNALPKLHSHALVQLIFEQPYCRISNLTEQGIAKRQTASIYLKKLCQIGVLYELSVGREKLYVHPKLIQLMTTDNNLVQPY